MIYLDNAATTLQKPPEVARAMAAAVQTMTTPGRGTYPASSHAADTAYRCRILAARLFRVSAPERVIFTFNATHGLNIAIKSLVRPGDRVVISGYEHNAVTRPLAALGADVLAVQTPLFRPELLLRQFREAVTADTAAVICTHVSNVFGHILPVEEIAALCRERGVPFVLDASQSAGILPVSLEELGAAFIAMPGHKGLYGPQGSGLLLCGADHPDTILEGGTGSASALPGMPEDLPDRLEAGTHAMPAIAGLLEGLRFVARTGPARILEHESDLTARAAELLRRLPGTTVYAAPHGTGQAGVLSFQCRDMDCETVGERLGRMGIAVRAGLHCAPLAHRTAGTFRKGTVRISFSAFSREEELHHLVRSLERLLRRV